MSGFNPKLFIWARESANLSLDEAAKALSIKPPSLAVVESGSEAPSRALLLRMSKLYRRSLLTFYLENPPRKGDRGEDFRTVVEPIAIAAEARVDALVRDLRARQQLIRSVIEDEDDSPPLRVVGSASISWGVEKLRDTLVAWLDFNRLEFRSKASAEQAFALLREKVEATGIFVLLAGNLGSHHSTIPVEAFRGFAIADSIAPFIVINDQDAKTAWSFTLLHELVHLWLGASGVSGGKAELQIEKFCNEVAASILIARDEVLTINVSTSNIDEQIEILGKFAKEWKVSKQMLAYSLLKANRISPAFWRSLDTQLKEIWATERIRAKEMKKSNESGPSYYVVKRHRLGKAVLDFASRSIFEGTLSPSKAAQVLGVKPRSVFPLLNPVA
jgi:Zn-dependent peptidase ImmA (M78 family)/transcriptional regulator with XRE-family HTH domain